MRLLNKQWCQHVGMLGVNYLARQTFPLRSHLAVFSHRRTLVPHLFFLEHYETTRPQVIRKFIPFSQGV